MKFTISSSSNDMIDEKYKKAANNLLNYLVNKDDSELCWGSGSISIMGMCYDAFSKANKNIYGYTTKKYVADIDNLPNAKHKIFDSTFALKENIFSDGDIIICLAGGTGTISEFFSYLEELRSNDVKKLLVIYDENHHFDSTLALIDDLIKRDFNSPNIYNYFKIAHSVEEFDVILNEYILENNK